MIKLNDKIVEFGKFPNSEINLDTSKLVVYMDTNIISWDYEDDADFFKLQVLKSVLPSSKCCLRIAYMPYSRMDRRNDCYAFTLKQVCEFLNNLGFTSVMITEPHSDVTPALLNNCFIDNWCINYLHNVFKKNDFDSLFFPDTGAQKRYSSSVPYGVGFKKRDFKTGNIIDFQIMGEVGKNVLIVDDLCSRGGTFIKSSIELKKKGAERISLIVAHCENNVFTGNLFDHIECLYTRKGILSKEHSQIKIIGE